MWRILAFLVVIVAVVGVVLLRPDLHSVKVVDAENAVAAAEPAPPPAHSPDSIFLKDGADAGLPALSPGGRLAYDPIFVRDCTVNVLYQQEVSSRLEGSLAKLLVDEGASVKAGQPLAELDDRELRILELIGKRDAESDIDIRSAEEEFKVAEKTVDRDSYSNRLAPNSVPQAEVLLNLARRDVARLKISKAKKDQEKAVNQLQQVTYKLNINTIRSEIDGEVTAKPKKLGESVKIGEPVYHVANFDKLRVEGPIDTQNANLIQPGMKAFVHAEIPAPLKAERGEHLAAVTSLAVTPKGEILASAGEDNRLILWRLAGTNLTFALSLQHPAEIR